MSAKTKALCECMLELPSAGEFGHVPVEPSGIDTALAVVGRGKVIVEGLTFSVFGLYRSGP